MRKKQHSGGKINFRIFECPTFSVESFSLKMRAMAVAETIFDVGLCAGLFQESDRRAVAFTMRLSTVSTPLFICKVGQSFPDVQFRGNCFAFAPEKIDRALRNGHNTSYLTRDGRTQWGGGFWLGIDDVKWGIGISGEKEWEDEGLGIVIALYTFEIPEYTMEMHEIMERGGSREFADSMLGATVRKIGLPAK